MYCRKCGSLIGVNDGFCRVCGTVVDRDDLQKREKEEKNDSAAKASSESEFHWNVYDFPRPQAHPTEEIDFVWDPEEERRRQEKKLREMQKAEEDDFWSKLGEIHPSNSEPKDIEDPESITEAATSEKASLGESEKESSANGELSVEGMTESPAKAAIPEVFPVAEKEDRRQTKEFPAAGESRRPQTLSESQELRKAEPKAPETNYKPEVPDVAGEPDVTEEHKITEKPVATEAPKETEETEAISEEELFRDMEQPLESDGDLLAQRNNTNFFTFTKKNEEFQKLLDREYERVCSKNPEQIRRRPLSRAENQTKKGVTRNTIPIRPRDILLADARELTEEAGIAEQGAAVFGAVAKDAVAAGVMGAAAIGTAAVLSASEKKEDLGVSPIQATIETAGQRQTEGNKETQSAGKAGSKYDQEAMDELARSLEKLFGINLEGKESAVAAESEKKETDPKTEEEPVTAEATMAEPEGEVLMVSQEEEPENQGELPVAEPEREPEKAPDEESAEMRAAVPQSADVPEVPAISEPPAVAETPVVTEATEVTKATVVAEPPAGAEPQSISQAPANGSEERKPVVDADPAALPAESDGKKEKPRKEKKKGRWVGTLILILLAVFVAAEGAALCIQQFAPDSKVGKVVCQYQDQFVEGLRVVFLIDQREALEKQEQEAPEEETQPEPLDESVIDTTPESNKELLVESQAGRNVNIKSIKANNELAYVQGKTYEIQGITESKPIENNLLLMNEEGKPVFADQEAVGAVIAFDSAWVAYVNSGNRTVFNYIYSGSRADQSAEQFSKVGKITEEFLSLEIGEIRQGSDAYYVWTREKIRVISGGTAQEKEYKWIYVLKVDGSLMKVADYIPY